MIRCQVAVDHGRLDVGVAHQLHDGWQVYTVHDQMAGEGVTQSVNAG